MSLTFKTRLGYFPLIGILKRPVAYVCLYSPKKDVDPHNIWMYVDTGADFTLFPKYVAETLHINLKKDCKRLKTHGVGGDETVYLLEGLKVTIGEWERTITVGFFDHNDIPPLLGRHGFLDTFDVTFNKNQSITFSS